ncbi:hypothetical protein CCP4SC76_2020019 [Gammaproteobacteria bacterium]
MHTSLYIKSLILPLFGFIRAIILGLTLYCIALPVFSAGHTTHEYINREAKQYLSNANLRELLGRKDKLFMDGSAQIDAGYGLIKFPFTEPMHWPEYHRNFFRNIKEACGGKLPGDDSCESLVALFMGIIGHSLVDNLWNYLLIEGSEQYDKPLGGNPIKEQDAIGDFLVLDQGGIGVVPTPGPSLNDYQFVVVQGKGAKERTFTTPPLIDAGVKAAKEIGASVYTQMKRVRLVPPYNADAFEWSFAGSNHYQASGYNAPDIGLSMFMQTGMSMGMRGLSVGQDAGEFLDDAIEAVTSVVEDLVNFLCFWCDGKQDVTVRDAIPDLYDIYPWMQHQWLSAPGGVYDLSRHVARVMDFYWDSLTTGAGGVNVTFFPDHNTPGLLRANDSEHQRYNLHLIFDRPVLKKDIKNIFNLVEKSTGRQPFFDVRFNGKDANRPIDFEDAYIMEGGGTDYAYVARIVQTSQPFESNTIYQVKLEGSVRDIFGNTSNLSLSEDVSTGTPYDILLRSLSGNFLEAQNEGGATWGNNPARLAMTPIDQPALGSVLNVTQGINYEDGYVFIRSIGGQGLSYAGGLKFNTIGADQGEVFRRQTNSTGNYNFVNYQCGGSGYLRAMSGSIDCNGSPSDSFSQFNEFMVSPPVGGWGGTPFFWSSSRAQQVSGDLHKIKAFLIRDSGFDVRAVGIRMNDGSTMWFGGQGGTETSLDVSIDALTYARVCYGVRNGDYRIIGLNLITRGGAGNGISIGPNTPVTIGGDNPDVCDTIKVPEGMFIDGVYGSAGARVDRLGFTFQKVPAPIIIEGTGNASTIDYSNWWLGTDLSHSCATVVAGGDNGGKWRTWPCDSTNKHACRNMSTGQWAVGDNADHWDRPRCPVGFTFDFPKNSDEDKALEAVLNNSAVMFAWINVKKDSDFTITGNSADPCANDYSQVGLYIPWAKCQPLPKNDSCIALNLADGFLYPKACDTALPHLCADYANRAMPGYLIDLSLNAQSDSDCGDKGLSVGYPEKADDITQLMQSSQASQLGTNKFIWTNMKYGNAYGGFYVDNTQYCQDYNYFSYYTNWAKCGPMKATNELRYKCAALNVETGYWYPADCSTPLYHACVKYNKDGIELYSIDASLNSFDNNKCGDGDYVFGQSGSANGNTILASQAKSTLLNAGRSEKLVWINMIFKDSSWQPGGNRCDYNKLSGDYSNWPICGPKHLDTRKCAAINLETGVWEAVDCNKSLPPLCVKINNPAMGGEQDEHSVSPRPGDFASSIKTCDYGGYYSYMPWAFGVPRSAYNNSYVATIGAGVLVHELPDIKERLVWINLKYDDSTRAWYRITSP